MKITHLQITSATLQLEFIPDAPICFVHGKNSDLTLDLLREVLGDCGAIQSPDRIDGGRFVLHTDIELDGKKYDVCYIRNSDDIGDNRLAVNFMAGSTEFPLLDTEEFLNKTHECNSDSSNVFDITKYNTDIPLSENDRRIACFENFIKQQNKDDKRPIFIYGFFDRIDEATDISEHLDILSSLDRQVFVAVCSSYPVERLAHNSVGVVSLGGGIGAL